MYIVHTLLLTDLLSTKKLQLFSILSCGKMAKYLTFNNKKNQRPRNFYTYSNEPLVLLFPL